MRILVAMTLVASLMVSTVSQAALSWSSCQTITGVVHEPIGSTGNVLLSLSPGISGCSAGGITGAPMFMIGYEGVAATDLGGFLADSLTAISSGRQVQITYDNSSSSCYSTAIAVGGISGNCP
jgi:hypothetical protein